MSPLPRPNIHPPVRPPAPARIVLAFGSNLGDRAGTIRSAIDALPAHGVTVTAMSTLVESTAVKPGGKDETAPRYLNGVALAQTALPPHALLRAIQAIEAQFGRVREEHWGDRTLDIDIIAYGHLLLADPDLVLPHPRAAERDFVLGPWLEIDPDAVLPGAGPVAGLIGRATEFPGDGA
ncbi:2-amino-4-hydroxy-6-hydroxymethyldihydropteridine diphosphokinase [Mycetocola manganoxydans]|uniref:2-amino-4-hydroxy-6-hydroxymethyldihydropteridine diphosphokinase n=1 Tax=Mycetocola manganoxydans TaxID=699879 RepID=A0A3L6ZL92_9MICO|nr:2-amino-4-hydroxy-6-hydroxymethyldihydropteridine diphosphokinase [Mycetocola manganoxydans]